MASIMRLQAVSVSEVKWSAQMDEFMVAAGLSWAHLKTVNVFEFYLQDMCSSKESQAIPQIMAFSSTLIILRLGFF